MDVELALKINRLVHNECKDVPHDIGLKIEELVRVHQSELNSCSTPDVSDSLPCRHNFIQKDTYWKSCTHCGMLAPLGQ
jgi:hypothetical protein